MDIQNSPPKRLLDQLRECIRYKHYSLRTEQAYVYWTRFYVRWCGMRHPRELGAPEVTGFLAMLANERKVSVSTHNQALSALLFLYRETLGIALPWMDEIQRPTRARRIPSVLTVAEVQRLLAALDGMPVPMALLTRLLYGTGMRLMEGLRLRVKDVDFERRAIVVRDAKGGKDRVVMLPCSLEQALRGQMAQARTLWEEDRAAQQPGVEVPHALETKYPGLGQRWGWFWIFPSPTLATDPRSGVQRRHHLYEERLQRAVAQADIVKPVSVHTLRHSFATHVLKVAAGGTTSPLDALTT